MVPARVPPIACLLCIVTAFALATTAAAAGDAPLTASSVAGTDPPAPASRPAPAAVAPRAPRAMPMITELRAVIEAERAQLKDLHARFRAAPDAGAALAIQGEIERVRTANEITLLRIQVEHARRAGRAAQAVELEKVIRQLETPPARVAPAVRSAPEPASR